MTRLLIRTTIAVILAAPIGWAVWASLQPIDRIFTESVVATSGSAQAPQWENYRLAMTRLPMWRFILNSLLITSTAVVGTVLSASMAAYSFTRHDWRGRRIWLGLAFIAMMLPTQMLVIPQFLIFQHLGWVNTYKPLIVPAWLGGSAFSILLFYQFFRGVPHAYQDAARLDGATDWQAYWCIMLPMSKPVIGAVIAISFVAHWQAFLAPLIYLSDYERYPVSVGLQMFQSLEGSWVNLTMAASIVALLPPLAITLISQRYLMRSLSSR